MGPNYYTLPNGKQFALVEVDPFAWWQIVVPPGQTLPTQLQGLWTDKYQAWIAAREVIGALYL